MSNPLVPTKPKPVSIMPTNKSAGILDDYAVRKSVSTQEGTIEKVPVNDNDIVNKAYADSLIGGGSTHDILSATHTDSAASAVSRGSIIVGNSTPAWSELAVGTNGQVLTTDGTDVSWGSAGGSYTAGNGLDLTASEFSVDLKANGGLVIETTELAVDLSASSITGTLPISKTALVAGTNITLTTNTLDVDDAFLINNGNDTTTGILTAASYVASGSAGTSAQWDTAYTHSQDNTQAHSDYLLNSAADVGVGLTLTGDNSAADTAYVPMVLYNTDATPPTASTFPIGTLYVQYTP